MRRLYFLLATLIILSCKVSFSQITYASLRNASIKSDRKIELKNSVLKNSNIETSDDIVINGDTLYLFNTTIRCDKIIFEKSLKVIKSSGEVTIECRTIEVRRDSDKVLSFKKSTPWKCSLVIGYSEYFIGNGVEIMNHDNLHLSIYKK